MSSTDGVERAASDAPVWMSAEAASGWASGWNEAVTFLRYREPETVAAPPARPQEVLLVTFAVVIDKGDDDWAAVRTAIGDGAARLYNHETASWSAEEEATYQ